jgi:PhnB protein
MALINPYINFNGNAEDAFHFINQFFESSQWSCFKDMANDEFPIPAHEANKIMHIALPIGKNILMGNDVPESMGRVNENENRSKISISAESREEADQLFKDSRLAEPLKFLLESPWNSYFGMFRDQFGIEWMVDFDPITKAK